VSGTFCNRRLRQGEAPQEDVSFEAHAAQCALQQANILNVLVERGVALCRKNVTLENDNATLAQETKVLKQRVFELERRLEVGPRAWLPRSAAKSARRTQSDRNLILPT
jgi:hypothetical protein